MFEKAAVWGESLMKSAEGMDTRPYEQLAASLENFFSNQNNLKLLTQLAGEVAAITGGLVLLSAALLDAWNWMNAGSTAAYVLKMAILGVTFGPILAGLVMMKDTALAAVAAMQSLAGALGFGGTGGAIALPSFSAAEPIRAMNSGNLPLLSNALGTFSDPGRSNSTTNNASNPTINISASGTSGDPQQLASLIAREVKTQLKNVTGSLGV
jgi:hypothetical protein